MQSPNLQVLVLDECVCSQQGLAELPATLTSLVLSACSGDWHMPYFNRAPPVLHLDPDSTPGLARMAALKCLSVARVASVDAAICAGLTGLAKLVVGTGTLMTAANELGLAVLTRLTKLQHLQLDCGRGDEPAVLIPADAAGLTASSQLTALHLSKGLVPQELYVDMFPDGRKLPHLRELHATMGLLGDWDATVEMVQCCPNLEVLDVSVEGETAGALQFDDWDERRHSFSLLADLKYMTSLLVDLSPAADASSGALAWDGLAVLTGLKQLSIQRAAIEQFAGMLQLTTLQQLTELRCGGDQTTLLSWSWALSTW